MAKQQWDPLSIVPNPQTVRSELEKSEKLSERLRILLELSERIHATRNPNSDQANNTRELVTA